MISHKWQPISPLPETHGYDFSEIDSLHRQWLKFRNKREVSSPGQFDAFVEQLTRSLAIETGIIEGVYTLARGMTQTLVMRGISADLIEQDSTNKDPHELALILEDHQDAVKGVYAEIREGHTITRSSIRQIHAVLTRHQPTYSAVDQFGRRFDALLDHGGFKKLPNNPTRPDGSIHEYCPPEHVDSELDNLLSWYHLYLTDAQRYHPLLTGAWFHHRFTQIHPFQDGNGRVVRALLTWHLVQGDYLPVVVTRDHRPEYISALEHGDRGNLSPFADLLAGLQKQTILTALVAPNAAEQPRLVDDALEYLVGRIKIQNEGAANEIRAADALALALRDHAACWMSEQVEKIRSRLQQAGSVVTGSVNRGGPGYQQPRHHIDLDAQIYARSEFYGYPINRDHSTCFTELILQPLEMTRRPTLRFRVLFHHIGAQFTGIMVANAFTFFEGYLDAREPAPQHLVFIGATPGLWHGEPFTFTSGNTANDLFPRFKHWAEVKLAMALSEWGERFN